MEFWIKFFSATIPLLLITNRLGWTHIPPIILNISGAVLVAFWAWIILIATVLIIDKVKDKM